ncbi:hypothetical protein FCM35_KLT06540 [Carex littledalei]|uniref:F-box domain-containing protein n=1 Tax=Carex littledalei TaxID=544730 RepID=A0A833R0Y5_9POAL|nr:hypothetical protein FCM35_KLT06540 [Carex littledalei]
MKATTIFNFIFKGKGSDNKELQDHFSRLPLDCLMTVMKLTSPKDTCRSAAVNTTFQSVANSDDVWQSFLPDNLSSILDRAETDVEQLPVSKKELYLHLCHNWILLDGGTKVKWMAIIILNGYRLARISYKRR